MGRLVHRYFFGPAAPARPWLFTKSVLVLLAFDCWIDLSPHGGRYGIGDFNVAHFVWLDAITPTPEPSFYVGLVCFCGLLALTAAIGGMNRWVLGTLAVVFTYSWAMSMLDSYQHHYLLTILLIAFALYPSVTCRLLAAPPAEEETAVDSAETRSLPGGNLSAWAYHATAVSIGIVYSYTALSKSEPQWRDGSALQRIATEQMAPFYEYFVDSRGWEHETFWTMMGTSVILLQILIAAGYYCAPLLDRDDLSWPKWVCGAAWFGAMNFHIGAEYLDLQIGWFSYYMLIAGCVFLLPRRAVSAFGIMVAIPVNAAVDALTGEESEESGSPLPVAIGVAAVTGLAGYAVDMPGVVVASVLIGTLLIVFVAAKQAAGSPLTWIAGTGVAALCMWLAFVGTEARYDYYRFVGGDYRRRGELEESLEAYIKANDYAPEDDNRREREDEVRRGLGLSPRWSGTE